MGWTSRRALCCIGTGLCMYFFHVLPNIWLLWQYLDMASYPNEALDSANTLECTLLVLASTAFCLMAGGWTAANDPIAPLLLLVSFAGFSACVFLLDMHGNNMATLAVFAQFALLLIVFMGTTIETKVENDKGWYKFSLVKKEFCIAAIALLVALSFRAQPSCFARLEQTNLPLTISTEAQKEMKFGTGHILRVAGNGGVELAALHKDGKEKSLFTNVNNGGFIVGALNGHLTAFNDHEMSLFVIDDRPGEFSVSQTIDASGILSDGNSVFLRGTLGYTSGKKVDYNMTFTSASEDNVVFHVSQSDADSSRTYLITESDENEGVFGLGIQYTYFNLKGGCVPIFTVEQGIGRGLQPLTYLLNLAAEYAAGSWQTSYSPAPYFLSSKRKAMYLQDTEFAVFDFSRDDRIAVELNSSSMTGGFCDGDTPVQVISCYARNHAGYMRALPDWTGNGAIVGLQGGRQMVKDKLKTLRDGGVPVVALWLQDWSGKRETLLGRRLQWNWEVDEAFYPDWEQFIIDLAKEGTYVLSYINTYVADTGTKTGVFDQAKELDCLLKSGDGKILIQNSGTGEFTFGTVDVMDERCQKWYVEEVLRKNLIGESTTSFSQVHGALGFMADFAEGISMEAVSKSGLGHEFHNKFPLQWAATCRKAIAMNKFTEENVVFFTRSGAGQTPGESTLMWMGDQLTTWDEYDGMKSALGGLLSGGVSGFSLTHSDIGGYTMVRFLYLRSDELFMRWTEMNVFSDAVFRTHEGLIPDDSAQAYSPSVIAHFASFATLHTKLYPLLKKPLITEASRSGVPYIRHLMLHYPDDPQVYKPQMRFQFLVGEHVLVCPVFASGVESVRCYVPEGEWTHVFTGEKYSSEYIECKAPIGRPCVLVLPQAKKVAQVIKNTILPSS